MDEELLDIVNEKDEVVGKGTKGEKTLKGFISRNVAVLIFEDSGNLVVARRSLKKKNFPGKYDLSVAGNVAAGESYGKAAERELAEELGIRDCELTFLKKIYNELGNLRYFTAIFSGVYSGKLRANDELIELASVPLKELDRMLEAEPDRFVPFFINDFKAVRSLLGKRK
jgi:16S rRNA (adenine1518-N6/adenine1519-N6)-dimethyltransferase